MKTNIERFEIREATKKAVPLTGWTIQRMEGEALDRPGEEF